MRKKNGKRLGFCVLVAVFLQSCIFTGGAGAGDFVSKGLALEAAVLLGAKIASLVYSKKEYQEKLDESTKDEERYADDHATLKDIVFSDSSGDMQSLYNMLYSNSALSFAAQLDIEKFEAQNPGYRDTSKEGYISFAEIDKDRMSQWQDYAYGVFEANNHEAYDVKSSQGLIKKLNTAFLNAEGYRQLVQASSQTSDFMGQEVVRLRLDMQRALEAQMKYALNEWQEDADEQAAFEEGIKSWNTQSSGKNY
jgi:DNA-binding helix-hairpin-helix protein with protein kinase domain